MGLRRADTSSIGRPKVLAQPCWRRSSSMRSGVAAMRREPTSRQPGERPVSAGFGLEAPVDVDAVHHHPGQGQGRPELADQAGRVERAPAGRLGPVEDEHVGAPGLGQVVGDARARRPPRR